MNIEYIIYEYLKKETQRFKNTVSFHVPMTEDLIRTLVGQFGLDILRDTGLIEQTAYGNLYVLSCEEVCV